MKNINLKRILGILILIFLASSTQLIGQIIPGCKYLISNQDDVIAVTVKIPGLNSSKISAERFKSSQGVFIPCNFYYDSLHSRQAIIKSKRYTYKRDGKILISRISLGPYWTDTIKKDLLLVQPGDSLIINEIKADLIFEDTAVHLNNFDNFVFEPIELVFTSPLEIKTNVEKRFDDAMGFISIFRKLVDTFSSGDNIDASFIIYDWNSNKNTGVSKKRYQFKYGSRSVYDLTFIQNGKGAISRVYDNLKRKEYTIKQWENLMRNVK